MDESYVLKKLNEKFDCISIVKPYTDKNYIAFTSMIKFSDSNFILFHNTYTNKLILVTRNEPSCKEDVDKDLQILSRLNMDSIEERERFSVSERSGLPNSSKIITILILKYYGYYFPGIFNFRFHYDFIILLNKYIPQINFNEIKKNFKTRDEIENEKKKILNQKYIDAVNKLPNLTDAQKTDLINKTLYS